MRCPKCGYTESRVIDSRPAESGDAIRRRRECLNPDCRTRFTTYERREEHPLQVRKRNGSLETFDRDKLLASLMTATVKRDIPIEKLNSLISDIESELRNDFRTEVDSRELGDMILRRLLKLDKVAYVRFASVYKDFQDLDGFYKELGNIK
ncbi:transcriptional repressor NrdR [bacterium]|nr:transcriptional repressor NrdR [bacterium]